MNPNDISETTVAAGVPVSAINWPVVTRITLQGAALCALTALTMWASGVETNNWTITLWK